MQLPRAVALANKYVGNRVQGVWAPYLAPWAVVVHRGRRSGKRYSTPIVGFATAQGFAVPMLYGPDTQWVKNLLAAGGGELRRRGRRYRLVDPRVLTRSDITARGPAGRYVRAAPTALVATLEPVTTAAASDSAVSWDETLRALRTETDRVIALLRSGAASGDEPALGSWSLAEVAAHLSHVWIGLPSLADGERGVDEHELVAAAGVTLSLADIGELSALTTTLVRTDGERDLPVVAQHIEDRARDYFAACRDADPDTRRTWLVEGTTLPTSSFTAHLLNETVLHGYDIATAARRPWHVDPRSARLALEQFLFPVAAMLDPRTLVDATRAAGVRATVELRIRGGRRFHLVFGDGAMRVEAPSARRADCVFSADPAALLLLFWGRRGQWRAVASGKVTAWGRRPWLALRLASMIKSP